MRPLNDGDTLYLGSMGSFTIRANTCDGIVGSVIFDLNGSFFRKENLFPYDIMGGSFSSPAAFIPPVGTHTVVATPYDGKNGRGMMGIAETVTFHVVAGMAPRTAGSGTTDPTDQTGQQSALGGTAALDASSQTDLILFPNPTNGTATLSESVAFSLYSLMGQEVRRAETATNTVDVKGLAKGTYVLITRDGRSLKVVVK